MQIKNYDITSFYNNNKHNYSSKLNFEGHIRMEKLKSESYGRNILIQKTSFFRQMDTIKALKKYLENNFKSCKSIKIFDGACSSGEESWTIAMMLKNLPIQITGFDLGEKAIKSAKKGTYQIVTPKKEIHYNDLKYHIENDAYQDAFLSSQNIADLSPDSIEYKMLFNDFFKKVLNLENLLVNNFSKNKIKTFKIKPEKENICNFIPGDITKLKDIIKNNEADVILFRNALYHITTTGNVHENLKDAGEITNRLNKIFKDIHDCLSDKGVFVLGTHKKDHIESGQGKLIYRLLGKNGFEPAHIENNMVSIWKKKKQ